jgi:transcriptional regulator with XRE-family HTH domain
VEPYDSEALYRGIGERIRNLRQNRLPKLSQRVLAGKIGLSRASMANIENGRHRIQIHVLYDIARVLGGGPADLLPTPNPSDLPRSFAESLKPKELDAVKRLLSSEDPSDA